MKRRSVVVAVVVAVSLIVLLLLHAFYSRPLTPNSPSTPGDDTEGPTSLEETTAPIGPESQNSNLPNTGPSE